MKLRTFLVAGVSALLGLSLTLVVVDGIWAQADIPKSARTDGAPGAGRYQGAVGTTHVWLFDTATGEVWSARSGEKWKHEVDAVQP